MAPTSSSPVAIPSGSSARPPTSTRTRSRPSTRTIPRLWRRSSTASPPGFVDTPLSAAILGDGLEARREQLRATLPIRRVVGPADVAALAVHLMINTAITGATFSIDGGQQLVE